MSYYPEFCGKANNLTYLRTFYRWLTEICLVLASFVSGCKDKMSVYQVKNVITGHFVLYIGE